VRVNSSVGIRSFCVTLRCEGIDMATQRASGRRSPGLVNGERDKQADPILSAPIGRDGESPLAATVST
ncbi:MAG: hypothetical protein AAF907_15100, partial [Planctomycetota bacterium]